MRSSCGLLAFFCALACQAGTEPKAQPAEYPLSATQPQFALGAEFLVHSLLTPKGDLFLRDYLVVEVALYPSPGSRLKISHQDFRLRVQAKKLDLAAEAPEMVAAAVKYPDREKQTEAVATVALDDGSIMVGRPAPQERFPGDPTTRTGPRAPKVPTTDTPGVDPQAKPEEELHPDLWAGKLALSEGEYDKPMSGYLYFHFEGKVKSLKTLELVYSPGVGSATLRLR